jgi:hypothetical protein
MQGVLFFEKRPKRTLGYKALALPRGVRQMEKSFCFFFQKEVLSRCPSGANLTLTTRAAGNLPHQTKG